MSDDLACRDVVELLTSYLDGVLDEATASAVAQHLSECRGCETYLEQLRFVSRTIGSSDEGERQPISEESLAELVRAFRATFPESSST